MSKTSPGNDSESTVLGWKFVIIVAVITTIFFSFLYLAMSSEPDYMPSQQSKKSQQQSPESLAKTTDLRHNQNNTVNPSQHTDQQLQHQSKQ